MNLKHQLLKNKDDVILYLFVILIILLVGGLLLFPTFFYDHFIWKYFIGPVLEDVHNTPMYYHQIKAAEKFTVVSELVYGLSAFLIMYYVYRLLKKLKIQINTAFACALLPYFAYGAIARVLEDSQYFVPPYSYWFVTPFIYIQILCFAVIFGLLGWFFNRRFEQQEKRYCMVYPLIVVLFFDFILTAVWFFSASFQMQEAEIIGLFLVSFLCTAPLILFFYSRKTCIVYVFILTGGLLLLLPSVYLSIRWMIGFQWSNTIGIRFDVAALVLGAATLVVWCVYGIAVTWKKNSKIAIFKDPLNLSMIFGQLLDGFTSFISIKNPLGFSDLQYSEKHFLSTGILDIWGPLYPLLKFIFIILVIYLVDVFYKKDLKKYSELVIIFKIVILLLGFSPGLRDILRVTMGV